MQIYDKIEIYHDHSLIAEYSRSYGRNEELMDWTQYVRTLCKKPGAAEHTKFFNSMPKQWQDYLSETKGKERRSALQLLNDIVCDENAEHCADILALAKESGISDAETIRQCYYSLLREEKTPEPLALLAKVPTINYNPDLSVYDELTGGVFGG